MHVEDRHGLDELRREDFSDRHQSHEHETHHGDHGGEHAPPFFFPVLGKILGKYGDESY